VSPALTIATFLSDSLGRAFGGGLVGDEGRAASVGMAPPVSFLVSLTVDLIEGLASGVGLGERDFISTKGWLDFIEEGPGSGRLGAPGACFSFVPEDSTGKEEGGMGIFCWLLEGSGGIEVMIRSWELSKNPLTKKKNEPMATKIVRAIAIFLKRIKRIVFVKRFVKIIKEDDRQGQEEK
jgi:hypothetical protein